MDDRKYIFKPSVSDLSLETYLSILTLGLSLVFLKIWPHEYSSILYFGFAVIITLWHMINDVFVSLFEVSEAKGFIGVDTKAANDE